MGCRKAPQPHSYFEVVMPTFSVFTGDALHTLGQIEEETIDCCITSPPYWGLRDYGHEGQLGLEPTPEAYVANLVALFREVRRVLKPTGTLWLNLGDSYAANGKSGLNTGWAERAKEYAGGGHRAEPARHTAEKRVQHGLKPKDLVGIPWRVAFALQQPYYAGRIKRVEDRIWLAAMIDAEGCMFIHKRKAGQSNGQGYERQNDTYSSGLEVANTSEAVVKRCMEITGLGSICSQTPEQNPGRKQTIFRWNLRTIECKNIIREVYPHIVAKQQQARIAFGCPSSGEKADAAHQALIGLHRGIQTDVDFPEPPSMFEPGFYLRQDIIWAKSNPMPESVRDRCTKAHEYVFLLSKSERYFYDAEAVKEPGVIPAGTRGAKGSAERFAIPGVNSRPPEYKVYDGKRNRRDVWTIPTKPFSGAHFAVMPEALVEPCILAGCPIGGMVMDPFAGSGTVGVVAIRTGRNFIGIELNPEYREMAFKRISSESFSRLF